MELYAGMVDNLDYNIGRIMQYLKDIGEFENTLIVFMSDNGAASGDFYHDDVYGPFIKEHFNVDYENMGKPDSFISYGPQWAEAGSAPFRYFKGFTTEGGMNTPMIISGPGVANKNSIEHTFLTLMDLAPTFYEIAGASYPKSFNGNKIYSLKGNSLITVISAKKKKVHDDNYVFGLEHGNKAMLRKGEWKITNIDKPYSPDNFKLDNISKDLAELHDLRGVEKEKYKEMRAEWEKFSKEIKMQVPVPKAKEQD
ncbi:MAG: sulfatase-like hydrolase/transferase [Flavobacteriaceae bacterium]|nr:sulfatase-like hydrolase/transferase [Flavobacteriaceae bacterium]